MLYPVKFGLNVVMLVPDAMSVSCVAKGIHSPELLEPHVAFIAIPPHAFPSGSVHITYRFGCLAIFVE